MSYETKPSGQNFPLARRPATNMQAAYGRGQVPPTGNDLSNILSPAFFLWVFKQWWKIGIPCGLLLAALVAGWVIYSFVPTYEASALLTIEDQRTQIVFSNGGDSGENYVQTQIELLRSRVVLEPVLKYPEIASAPEIVGQADRVSALGRYLYVRRLGGSQLYNVTCTSKSPEFARSVVNRTIEEYLKLLKADEFDRTKTISDILQYEQNRREGNVADLRKRVVRLAEEATHSDPFTNRTTDIKGTSSPAGALYQILASYDADKEMIKANQMALDEEETSGKELVDSTGLINLQVASLPEVKQLESAIWQSELAMNAYRKDKVGMLANWNSEKDENFNKLQAEIARLQEELDTAKIKGRDSIVEMQQNVRQAEREREREKLNRDMKALDMRRAQVDRRYQEQKADLEAGAGKSVELEFAKDELGRVEKVFEMIASRTIAMQTESRSPPRVRVRQEARVPDVPVEKMPYKFLFLACSAALVAPFGLAIAREATVQRINDVVHLAQESRLRVLGEISAMPVRYVATSPGRMLPNLRRASYVFAESINSLRTNFSVAAAVTKRQVLAITSATSGEGKSSVATSLAMSIADTTGHRTLIIDGDLRSPDVATMLKTPAQPGLYEVLAGTCSLDEAIHQVGDGNLFVLPAGRATRNPHLVLKLDEAKRMLDELRPRFATIVIDTPPILGASESLLLAKIADTALFCSLCEVSRAKQVRLAVERLEHAGVNVAGAVLSGTTVARYASVYGYYENRADAIE